MSDGNMIPISDEQAKLGQEILKAGKDAGRYLAEIMGDLPKDLVNLLLETELKSGAKRGWRNFGRAPMNVLLSKEFPSQLR